MWGDGQNPWDREYDEEASRHDVNNFVGCCGIDELSNMDNMTEKSLKGAEKEILAQSGTYAVTTLVADQRKKYKTLLEKRGWKLLSRFKNHNGGNTVYLYGKNLRSRRRTPKKGN